MALTHELYRHTEGKLGTEILDRPPWMAIALSVVDDAIEYRREDPTDAD